MWHQWRLSKHSISTERVSWEKLDEETRERFLEQAGLSELPEILALHQARFLDRTLSGDVAEDDAVLRDLLQKRNRSILAHGLEPIGEEAALRFLEYADRLVEAPEARAGAGHATLRRL
jgi:hypothetical protein